jgi:predicted lipoprotein
MKTRWSPVRIAAVAGVGLFLIVSVAFGFTVVSAEKEAELTQVFDPATYVAGVWDSVRSTIVDESVDLALILNKIKPDASGKAPKDQLKPIAEEFGLITTGEAHVYKVAASGTVTDVDTSSSRGSLGLTVDGYDGPIKVRAYIGPRIPSDETSVRDATGMITFGDFKEQTEYGKVAAEINKRVLAGLAGLDPESLVGKAVTLHGAMTMRTFNLNEIDVSQLMVVPLDITPQ